MVEQLDTEDSVHTWNGQTNTGESITEDELFEFSIDYYSGSEYISLGAPQLITTITEVGSENGTLRFGTSSHLSADLYSVTKYRDEG